MARVVAVVSDLMLASRVTTALAGAGYEVEQAAELPAELEGVDLVVADLDTTSAQALAASAAPVIGFHQHTDAETKARAEAAELELVVPRSRMARELPELAARVLEGA